MAVTCSDGHADQLDSVFILHPMFMQVARILRKELDSANSKTRSNYLVTGPSGVGKTTLQKHLLSLYPRTEDGRVLDLGHGLTATCDEVPALCIRLRSQPTAKIITRNLLAAIGDPRARHGGYEELAARLAHFVKQCGVRVIFIDEAQRAVDRDGVVRRHDIAELLKDLHDETGVSICLLGMGRTKALFEDDAQIARLWSNELPLAPYGWGDPAKRGRRGDEARIFMGILKAYADRLPVPLDVELNVSNPEIAQRFYFVTRGVIGYLKKLLIGATKVAESLGAGTIGYSILSEALSKEFLSFDIDPSLRVDPFVPQWEPCAPPPLPDHTKLLERPAERARRGAKRERRHRAIGALSRAA